MNELIKDTDIIESLIVNELQIDSLCVKILEKESYIKNLNTNTKLTFELVNDGSITKYHNYYNLIEFGFEEVDLIVKKIKELVFKINGWDTFYIKMWANIYRKDDYIGYHTHLPKSDKFNNPNALSGHCFLHSTKPTFTTYYFTQTNIKPSILGYGGSKGADILNVPGEISIFSSYVPHEFKKWDGDLRIGIAFDITHEGINNEEFLKHHKYILI